MATNVEKLNAAAMFLLYYTHNINQLNEVFYGYHESLARRIQR